MVPAILPRILVVDDDAAVRASMALLLSTMGRAAILAADAAEALDLVAHGDPDLAIVDIGLPDMDGRDLVKKLRIFAPHMPIVIMTGLVDAISDREMSVDLFLEKPVSADRIRSMLNHFMRADAFDPERT